jgi:hypothetical protein
MKYIDSRSGAKQTITEDQLVIDTCKYFEENGYSKEDGDFCASIHYGDELYFSFHELMSATREEMEADAKNLQEHLYQLHGMKFDLKTCGKHSFKLKPQAAAGTILNLL